MDTAANSSAGEVDRETESFARDVGIPPCPEILTRLMREMREDDPDVRRIGQLVGRDVALAAATLRLANSPFFGLRTKLGSVQQAITLLGLNTISQLITGLLLRQAFPDSAGLHLEAFWKASAGTATAAALVARETRKADHGAAYTYGLFRDCGMPVMLRKMPAYADILNGSGIPPGESIIDVEDERYGTNHARIGGYFAHSWHLPEALSLAILHHHDLPPEASFGAEVAALLAVGVVAGEICQRAHSRSSPDWTAGGEWALGLLTLGEDDLPGLVQRYIESVSAA